MSWFVQVKLSVLTLPWLGFCKLFMRGCISEEEFGTVGQSPAFIEIFKKKKKNPIFFGHVVSGRLQIHAGAGISSQDICCQATDIPMPFLLFFRPFHTRHRHVFAPDSLKEQRLPALEMVFPSSQTPARIFSFLRSCPLFFSSYQNSYLAVR